MSRMNWKSLKSNWWENYINPPSLGEKLNKRRSWLRRHQVVPVVEMNLSENGEIPPSATLMGEIMVKCWIWVAYFLRSPNANTTRSEKAQLLGAPQLFQEQLMRLMRWVLPERKAFGCIKIETKDLKKSVGWICSWLTFIRVSWQLALQLWNSCRGKKMHSDQEKNRKGCIGQALARQLRCKLGIPKEIICLQIISSLCALHVDRTSLFPLFLLVCVLARILCNREAALVKVSCAWRRITNLCSMLKYEHNKDAVFEDVRSIQRSQELHVSKCEEESAWLSLELGHTMVLEREGWKIER